MVYECKTHTQQFYDCQTRYNCTPPQRTFPVKFGCHWQFFQKKDLMQTSTNLHYILQTITYKLYGDHLSIESKPQTLLVIDTYCIRRCQSIHNDSQGCRNTNRNGTKLIQWIPSMTISQTDIDRSQVMAVACMSYIHEKLKKPFIYSI